MTVWFTLPWISWFTYWLTSDSADSRLDSLLIQLIHVLVHSWFSWFTSWFTSESVDSRLDSLVLIHLIHLVWFTWFWFRIGWITGSDSLDSPDSLGLIHLIHLIDSLDLIHLLDSHDLIHLVPIHVNHWFCCGIGWFTWVHQKVWGKLCFSTLIQDIYQFNWMFLNTWYKTWFRLPTLFDALLLRNH